MKKNSMRIIIFFAVTVSVFQLTLFAQTSITPALPTASQKAAIMQRVGLTDITIVYHSPAVKKRAIWGKLVPYDKVWRAGANENTTISFTHDVKVEGKDLAKGTYGLHTIPGKDQWTIIFSKNHTSWGSYFYKKEEDALRVTVKPEEAPFREWLAYDFTARESHSTVVSLLWAKLRVPFTIEVDVNKVVVKSLRNEMRTLPFWFWRGTYSAAQFCLNNSVNLEEALTWIDQSIRTEENYQNLMLKAEILEKLGKTADVGAVKKKAYKIATEMDYRRYIMNYLSDKAKAVEYIMECANRFKTMTAWRAVARVYNYFNDKENALKYFKVALKKAKADQKKALQMEMDRIK